MNGAAGFRCGACAHSFRDSDSDKAPTVCRLNPPQVLTVLAQHPISGQATQQIVSAFPSVNDDAYCSHWKGALKIAS